MNELFLIILGVIGIIALIYLFVNATDPTLKAIHLSTLLFGAIVGILYLLGIQNVSESSSAILGIVSIIIFFSLKFLFSNNR